MQLQVVGFDPSLRNWGIAKGVIDIQEQCLVVQQLRVTTPVLPKAKQIRQNSQDLESARQLYEEAWAFAKDAQAIFVEVPVGSQSARAMASYGICVGILGSLRAAGIPFFEVTPLEVKKASCGKVTASKQEMITWAMNNHPDAPWPTYQQHNKLLVSEAKAEHMADAIGAIYAGVRDNQFKQWFNLITQKENVCKSR